MQVNMNEAKSQLSKLGRMAWEGEEVIIAKAGKPFLKLVPYVAEGVTPCNSSALGSGHPYGRIPPVPLGRSHDSSCRPRR